jgi:hypothetical protein
MLPACVIANRLCADERDIVTPASFDPYGLMPDDGAPSEPGVMPYNAEVLKALQNGKVTVG